MTPAPLLPQHRDAFLQAHREVFASTVDDDWYRWKYADPGNPSLAMWVGVPGESALMAHCGGTARTLLDRGVRRQALQIGDVMVCKAWRSGVRRSGAFYRVSSAFYAQHLGAGRPFEWGFGFPSHRHMKLAVALGLLHDAGPMVSAVWPCAPVRQAPGGLVLDLGRSWALRPLHGLDAQRQALAAAWRRMRSDAAHWVLGERSPQTVLWRHTQKPTEPGGRTPQLWALSRTWGTDPVGVVVVGPGPTPTAAHWLDWVGPPRLLHLGLQAARHAAAGAGCQEVHAWLSAGPWQQLGAGGTLCHAEAARIGIPAASTLSAEEASRRPWWFMGADTDFL
ncbi:MAG: hypothetical protein ACKOB5_03900 [Betaproteobacteria bacterium]